MDFSMICRTCLSSDNLKPLFTNKSNQKKYSKEIYLVTGVEIHYNDQLPQNICTNCLQKFNKTLKFRQRCKNAEAKLLGLLEEKLKKKIGTKKNNNDDKSDVVMIWDDDDVVKIKTDEKLETENNDFEGDDLNYDLKTRNLDTDNKVYPKLELTEIMMNNYNDDNNKNDTDSDDDKPLKLLLDSENSDKLNENKINNYEYNDEIVDKFNSKIELVDSEERNNQLKSNHKMSLTKLEKEQTNQNYNTDLNTVKDGKMPESLWNSVDLTELPYELIKDPVTNKYSRVYCKLCSKELSVRSIATHMARRHPGADSRKVKCDLCDSYVMIDKLNRHKNMMHGNGSFICRYCKLQFEIKEKLVAHVNGCTARKRKRKFNDSGRELVECDVCNKMMQKASLRMHKAVKHAGLKPACQHCGRCFGNKFRLNEHCRAKHGYEKFKCKYCDFTSAGIMAMRNHERRHRDEKPYVCETCGTKFHASYLLIQHRQSHRTEKLVKCDLCPASFKANNSLHMHKLTCHSNSTYICTLCCRSYKCRHYAVKHVRHVHRYTGPTPPLTLVSKDIVTEAKN